MIDVDKWQEIIHALKANKIRTALTAFGVFWGIFMLIIMLGASKGLENGITAGMKDFATNSAFVWANKTAIPYKGYQRGRRYNFNNDDMLALKANIPEIDVLAPKINGYGKNGNNVTRGIKTGSFEIQGEYPEVMKINPYNILEGRFINAVDVQQMRKVANIGTRVRETLFKPGEPVVGQYIKIQGVYFQIIGIIDSKTEVNGGSKENVILPFTTLQKTYNFGDVVHYFAFTAPAGTDVEKVEKKIVEVVKKRHSIAPNDDQAVGHFNVSKEFKKMNGLFMGITALMWIVGIGTLIAGVVGVSNIMLVIVKERTQEIGIRRAIGATPRMIMGQIINESVFLTAMAGYFGLIMGIVIVELINKGIGEGGADSPFKHPEVDIKVAITALTILIICGIFAGIVPAKRAISLKPIEAIREEK